LEKIVVRILEIEVSKNKLFYRCDDRSCDNTFIDWCKLINEIELTMKEFTCVNDIKLILGEVNIMKDKLHQVRIKNHNMKASIVRIELMVIVNLICAMLMFVTIIMSMLNKWY